VFVCNSLAAKAQSVAEIFAFLEPRGFTLKNLISTNGLRNNEFLFVRDAPSAEVRLPA